MEGGEAKLISRVLQAGRHGPSQDQLCDVILVQDPLLVCADTVVRSGYHAVITVDYS